MQTSQTQQLTAKWEERKTLFPHPHPNYPRVFSNFLQKRGFDSNSAKTLFEFDLNRLTDPLKIKDMQVAVDRLEKAFVRQESIVVYGDYDLDGTPGSALLSEGLQALGYKSVKIVQPLRHFHGYGLHEELIREIKSDGVNLIVTVDLGITGHKGVDLINELGMDVIVTDHHQPTSVLPAALAVVNPNRTDDTSGLKYLCGAGVAFYLLRALRKQLCERQNVPPGACDLGKLLDLFCIATLTDMVPLVGDNRILTRFGMNKLSKTHRPALKELLAQLGLWGRDLTSDDIAIRFAPKLNALSRLEKDIRPLALFIETDSANSKNLVQITLKHNEERIALQAQAQILAEAIMQNVSQESRAYCLVQSTEIHKGVIGLVATRLCEAFSKPSFVGTPDEKGNIHFSARRPDFDNRSLIEVFNFASEILVRSGGHEAAAGFEVEPQNLATLLQRFDEFYSNHPMSQESVIEYDGEVGLPDLTDNLVKYFEALEPFGMSFPRPVFLFKNLSLKGRKILKAKHLKLSFESEQGNHIDALWFGAPEWALNEKHFIGFEFLAEIQSNHFRGQKTIQLQIIEGRYGQ